MLPEDEAAAGELSETTISKGPLTPGPKFLAVIRSYALRAVVEVDSAAVSCWPRFSDQQAESSAAAGSRARPGRRADRMRLAMRLAHRDHRPSLRVERRGGRRGGPCASRNAVDAAARRSRGRAGSSVSAASHGDRRRRCAAIRPIVVTRGMSSDRERDERDRDRPAGEEHGSARGRGRPARSTPGRNRARRCRPRRYGA